MRVTEAQGIRGRRVLQFGSGGFAVAPIAQAAHSLIATLVPGGRIGRHPAVADQLLIVLTGDAVVSGDDGEQVEVRPGHLVWWRAGENHETRSDGGLTALILEADGLSNALD